MAGYNNLDEEMYPDHHCSFQRNLSMQDYLSDWMYYPAEMRKSMEQLTVYVSALQDSLNKKLDIMKQLLQLTREQSDILKQDSPDMEHFDEHMEKKGVLLEEMAELDKGFDVLFNKIGSELKEKKYQYQSQILQMQNAIRSITDCGVQLEGLEKRNRDAFQRYLTGARKEIKSFKVSNKTATSYYQNMANQHREWQSYFLDQKK